MRPGWEQAQAYVEQQRQAGRADGEIAQALAQSGWSQEEVAALLWPQPTAVPPPPPTPEPPVDAEAELPAEAPVEPAPTPPFPEPSPSVLPPPPPILPTVIPPPSVPPPVATSLSTSYSALPTPPSGSSALAVWSLVLGIISFVLLPLALLVGPVGAILGIVSLAKHRPGQGMAIAGLILGVLTWLTALITLPFLSAILIPVFFRAEDTAKQTACLSNVKELALAQMMYVQDHDGRFPPAANWPAATLPYFKNPQLLLCPQDSRTDKQSAGGQETSYTMDDLMDAGKPAGILAPDEAILLFDGTSVFGPREDAAYRHNGGLSVGFVDGHAVWLEEESFTGKPAASDEEDGDPTADLNSDEVDESALDKPLLPDAKPSPPAKQPAPAKPKSDSPLSSLEKGFKWHWGTD